MKRVVLLTSCILILALCAAPALAQGPWGLTNKVRAAGEVDHQRLDALDVGALIAEDERNHQEMRGTVPLRVAHVRPTHYTPENSGTLEELGDGARLWRLSVTTPGAVFMSVSFANLEIPEGAEVWAYSAARDSQAGPYTRRHNNTSHILVTGAVAGDTVTVEMYLPKGAAMPDFTIEGVSHGYRDFLNFSDVPYRDGRMPPKVKVPALKAQACEVDVNCSEGNAWQNDKRAVARTFDGSYLCTGSMIANANQDCRLLFLTANHCISRAQTAAGTTFYWNFENSSCNSGDASTNESTYGSTLLVTGKTSDFTLLELTEAPPASFNVYWAGFDASGSTPSAATCLHHPAGDEKKVSHEYDAIEDGQSGGWGNDHWRVVGWDVGTTEGGSSGSGLWDPNHRIVGQLHGGTADCSGGWDEYGKLSVSWGLGASTHLGPSTVVDGHDDSGCTGGGGDPPGGCGEKNASCTDNADCCSNNCKPNGRCS